MPSSGHWASGGITVHHCHASLLWEYPERTHASIWRPSKMPYRSSPDWHLIPDPFHYKTIVVTTATTQLKEDQFSWRPGPYLLLVRLSTWTCNRKTISDISDEAKPSLNICSWGLCLSRKSSQQSKLDNGQPNVWIKTAVPNAQFLERVVTFCSIK